MNTKDVQLERIAQDHLRVETLVRRWSDSLDFHDCSVWCLKAALEAAYAAGAESTQRASTKRISAPRGPRKDLKVTVVYTHLNGPNVGKRITRTDYYRQLTPTQFIRMTERVKADEGKEFAHHLEVNTRIKFVKVTCC